MRVLITGGGTGGHVNPALAIANTIKQNDPDAVIAYVGTKRGIENKLVPKAGYPMYYVDVKGIKRSLSPSNIKAAYLALTSPIKAKKIIREFKPDIVVGTGGYVSWPVVKAASQMGIPTALHESNAIAGVAVKMLQKSVDRIYLNFEKTGESLSCNRAKLMKVGNPKQEKSSAFPINISTLSSHMREAWERKRSTTPFYAYERVHGKASRGVPYPRDRFYRA